MPTQIGLPVGQGNIGHHLIYFLEKARLIDVNFSRLRFADSRKIAGPIKIAGAAGEGGQCRLVVGFMRIAAIQACHRRLGQAGLHFHDGIRRILCSLVLIAQQLEHGDEVLNIGVAYFLRAAVLIHIIIAIGKPQPALIQLCDHMLAVLVVRACAQTKKRGNIQGMKPGDHRLHVVQIADGVNLFKIGLQRRQAGGLDLCRVHAGGVKVADLLLYAARLERAVRRFF